MQRFVFQLESVRRLRVQEEQVVHAELARVLRERQVVVDQIADSRNAETALYDYLREPGRSAAEMAHVAQYGTWHRQQLYSLSIKLRQYDKGVELVRTRLTAARAKRKALDTLREREHARWRTEQLRIEQAELDELATVRAARRGPLDQVAAA
jgi:flagellar export protein FliJ